MKNQTLFKKEANKRYYLHQKVRDEGFKLNAHKRTVYVGSDDTITDSIQKLSTRYGYNIQTLIPHST